MKMRNFLAAALALASAPSWSAPAERAAPARSYAQGQVWEYRSRPGEGKSLLKIQRIGTVPGLEANGPVYHISVNGLKLAPHVAGVLPHVPVSRETLDASVTRLSTRRPDFPGIEAGIEEWRQAQGGVFTISVAEIVELIDRSTRGLPAGPPAAEPAR